MYKYGFSGSTKSTKKRVTRHSDVMANEYAFIKRCSKNVNDHECKSRNIAGHHGWSTKKIFHFKSSKTARKTKYL